MYLRDSFLLDITIILLVVLTAYKKLVIPPWHLLVYNKLSNGQSVKDNSIGQSVKDNSMQYNQ